jgi:sulfur-carrier protein
MRVKVKVFAMLAKYVPGIKAGEPFDFDLQNGDTLSDLIKQLNLPQEEAKIAFVNGLAKPPDYQLQNNDEVGIFSPIGGG